MMFGNLKICKLHCHCLDGNVIEDDSPKFPITSSQTNVYFKLNTGNSETHEIVIFGTYQYLP